MPRSGPGGDWQGMALYDSAQQTLTMPVPHANIGAVRILIEMRLGHRASVSAPGMLSVSPS